MTQTQIDRTYELFESLTHGAFEHFLSGCAEDLYVTVRWDGPDHHLCVQIRDRRLVRVDGVLGGTRTQQCG